MSEEKSSHTAPPLASKPRLKLGFLDLPDIPDSVMFQPMTEEELAEWE